MATLRRFADEGSELVEFALVLPLLMILAVGIADLSNAFILRDKLTSAAREGARIAIAQPDEDLTQPSPATVRWVRDAILNYLDGAGVAVPLPGAAPACTGGAVTFLWTCSLNNGGTITIERGVPVPNGAGLVISTRVTVAYPYEWSFSRIAALLGPTDLQDSFTISSQSVMKNMPPS